MPWYCLNTHPKKEQLAAQNCMYQGFEVFIPSYIHVYPKIGERILPLFPSYIFVRFDPDNDVWYPLCHTVGVKRLFSIKPIMTAKSKEYGYIKPIPVPDPFIASLQAQGIIAPVRTVIPSIEPGARVKVTSGHFQNREGICSWSTAKRVALLLDVMNGKIEFTFNRDNVELIT